MITLHLSEGITCLHNHCINLMQLVCTTKVNLAYLYSSHLYRSPQHTFQFTEAQQDASKAQLLAESIATASPQCIRQTFLSCLGRGVWERDYVEGEISHFSNYMSKQHTYNTHQLRDQLELLYFNARSIVPKLDELLTLVQCEHPDVICIVESWLNSDILDSEICIPRYKVFRKDRNRHSDEVLLMLSQTAV